jgi:tRNA (guanine10-N2)-methyltransferase
MGAPEEEFVVCEEHAHASANCAPGPKQIFFGRLVGRGGRQAVNTYTLKKRGYISTTSMDAELALLTANMCLADPGKLFYDPFVGTGSIAIACAHYGALVMGSDIDGRTIRGKGGMGVGWSLGQYGLGDKWLGGFVADMTFSPLRDTSTQENVGSGIRRGGWLDGIVCDPPYGVREGLKVLGSRDGTGKEVVWVDGEMAHL